MKRQLRHSVLGLICLVGFGFGVSIAEARTVPAAAGMAAALGSAGDFAWLNTGVLAPNATAASPRIFVIPVVIDSPGVKNFIVRGTPSATLTCNVEQRGSVQQMIAIPVSAIGTNPVPVQMNVIAGNTVVVRCTFTSSNGRVLLVDHTP